MSKSFFRASTHIFLTTALIWGGVLPLLKSILAAPTPPGTVIDNFATGSFDGVISGTTSTVTSNTVTFTVLEVAGITATFDSAREATVAEAGVNAGSYQGIDGINTGDLAYFDFVLTNVGNDPTSFFIPALPSSVTDATFNAAIPIQIIAVDPDGSSGGTSPTPLSVNVTTAGNTLTLLGATNGYIPPQGTVTVRVPVKVTQTTVGSAISVVLGNTPPNDNSTNTQNQTYSAGGNDVYTVDLADGTVTPTQPGYTGTTPEANNPATPEKEASALGSQNLAAAYQLKGFKSVKLTNDVGGDGSVNQGDTVTWTVTYVNTGTGDITNLQLTDNLAASGTTFAGPLAIATNPNPLANGNPTTNASYDGNAQINLFSSAIALKPSEVVTVSIPVTINAGGTVPRTEQDQASATGNKNGGDVITAVLTDNVDNIPAAPLPTNVTVPASSITQSENTASIDPTTANVVAPVPTVADLSLNKTVNKTAPNVGDSVVYTITVTNSGPSNATGVQVRDQLPAGITYASDNGGGSYNSSTGIWTIGNLSATVGSNTVTLQITGTVNTSGTITNTAQVSASNQSDPDSTPNNNDASEDDQKSVVVTGVNSGPVFTCSTDLHIMQNENASLSTINRTATPYTLTPIGGASGVEYNALGFNPVDGYMYAIKNDNTGTIYRIDNTGTIQSLGSLTGWNSNWGSFWFSGTFLEDGTYVINNSLAKSNGNGSTDGENRIIKIDLVNMAVLSSSILGSTYDTIFDLAVNPLDGQIYGYNEANSGRIVKIDPNTLTVTEVSTAAQSGVAGRVASLFFDVFGRLFLYGSPSGNTTTFTQFLVADPTTGVITPVSTGPTVVRSDGATCTFGVGIEKTVSPTTTAPGSTVTYTYKITNQSNVPVTTTFVDNMDTNGNLGTVDANERRYVASTLNNPFGGTANSYGNTEQLQIAGVTIPPNTTNTITVSVLIPNVAFPNGTVLLNQACLNGSSSSSVVAYPASICSDDGDVTIFPNKTPLTITGSPTGNPSLLLVKRITAINGNTTGFTTVLDDTNDPNDNDPDWPSGFLVGGITTTAAPGDIVDYNIYFLNTGSAIANSVKICDPLSQYLTYIPNSYDGSTPTDGGGTTDLGIQLNFSGPSVYMTGNAVDAPDRGAFVAAGVAPTNCVIKNTVAVPPFIPMTAADNPNGTVTVNLTSVNNATGSGTPNTSYGYIRFRTQVK